MITFITGRTRSRGSHGGSSAGDREGKDALVRRLPSEIFPEYFLIRLNEFNQVATTPLEEWLDYLKNDPILTGKNRNGNR